MNLISSYTPSPPCLPPTPPHPDHSKLQKLLYSIQKFRSFTATIITPQRNQIGQIIQQSDLISFCILHDSKDIHYQYLFQVDIHLSTNLWKISATLLQDGRVFNVARNGILQIVCGFVLHTNKAMNLYSLRIHPFTGVVKFTYANHVSPDQMKDVFVYPVNFCEMVMVHVKEMVNRLDQRLLGKLLDMTNQIPITQILPTNIQQKLKYQTVQHLSQLSSTNPLFPSYTLSTKYMQNKKIKQIKRYISNSTIKYSFFSNNSDQYKIRFNPENNQKKIQQEKQQKIVRHNIKVMPFSKDVKKVLMLFTANTQALQEESVDGKVIDFSSIQPTPKEIKNICEILKIDTFQVNGKIYTPITIVSVEPETPIGVGGFAQISRIPVNIAVRQDPENPQGSSLGYKVIRQILVRKAAAKQKLYWEKEVIKHIGKGSCIFINKFFQAKLSPDSVNLDRAFFEDSILMEFCPERALNNYLCKMSPIISIKSKIFLLYQISVGLRYLKDYSIVHLDMKPENVLIRPATNMMTGLTFYLTKIIDFGEAYGDTLISRNKNRGHTCPYASPQLVRHSQSKYTQKSDIFSLGLNTVDIKRLTSSVLFQSNDRYIKFYSICTEKCKYYGYLPIMECLMRLAYKCISPISTSRPYVNWVCVILRSLLDVIQYFQN